MTLGNHVIVMTARSMRVFACLSGLALSLLAADTDANGRQAMVKGRHVRRLSPADLARLIADPDAGVRAELPGHDGLLNVEQLTVLARDKSPEVRQAVARALSAQELWQQVPAGAADARAALIATLLGDAVAAVRLAALPGASAAQQDTFARRTARTSS